MSRKRINLALQGGGAHGAFTWGVLDRLLEEDEIEIEGITATSAGAMNAAALKHGWIDGGNPGARAALDDFWLSLAGLDGPVAETVIAWLRAVSPSPIFLARAIELSPAVLATEAITRVLSPYQFNPLNYHPMRSVVERLTASARDHRCSTCNRRPVLQRPSWRIGSERAPGTSFEEATAKHRSPRSVQASDRPGSSWVAMVGRRRELKRTMPGP